MAHRGFLSIYGGLVPLGFTHSNLDCAFCMFLFIIPRLLKKAIRFRKKNRTLRSAESGSVLCHLVFRESALDLEHIGLAVNDGGGVHAGHGVLVVDVECPVGGVHIPVSGDAVDGLDVQAVLAFFAFHQAQLQQSFADGFLVGVDGDGHGVTFIVHDDKGE